MPLQDPSPAVVDPSTLGSLIRSRHRASSLTPGATLTTGSVWPDDSGNGHDLAVTAGTATVTANSINGRAAVTFSSGWSARKASNYFPNTHWGVISVAKFDAIAGNSSLWLDTAAGVNLIGETASPLMYTTGSGQANAISPTSRIRGDGWHSIYYSYGTAGTPYAGSQGKLSIDGQVWRTGTFPATVAGRGVIMPFSGAWRIAETIGLSRQPTWPEYMALQRYVSATYATYDPFASDTVVICLGNSTTQIGMPYYLARRLAADLGCPVVNMAVYGGTVSTMDSQKVEILDQVAQFRALGKKVVIPIHHGHNNDFGATTVTHLKSAFFSDLRAAGAYLLLTTSSTWGYNPTKEAGRTVLNTWIMGSEAPTYFDMRADVFGSSPEFGVYFDGSTTGSKNNYPALWDALSTDYVHPSKVDGCDKQAELIEPSVRTAIAAAPGLIDPKTVTPGAITSTSIAATCPAATGTKGSPTYQWYRAGVAVSGATGADLADSGLDPSTSYSYTRRATGADGYYRDTPAVSISTLGADSTPPTLSSSALAADGTTLTLTFDEAVTASGTPTGFTVSVAGSTRSATAGAPSGSTIVLTLSSAAYAGQAVTVSYSPGNVTDAAANALAAFGPTSATNGSTVPAPDSTAPTIAGATCSTDGLSIVLTASESVLPSTGVTGFSSAVAGLPRTVSSIARTSPTTITLTLASPVYAGESVTTSYTPGNVTDAAGNAMEAFSGLSATNGSEVEAPDVPPTPEEVAAAVWDYISRTLTS